VAGLFDRASCPGEKEPTSLSAPAARPVGPDSPLQRGPRQSNAHPARTFQNSRIKSEEQSSTARSCCASAFAPALAFAFALAAKLFIECGLGWPAALPGPLCGGESGPTGHAAGIGMATA
jgi:hypothetical protein